MQPRINVVTLGVKDLKKAKKFYQDMGWQASDASNENIVLFQAQGMVLSLYPQEFLAEDARIDARRDGFSGITLAYNVADKSEVAAVLEKAKTAGAKILKEAQDVFWGGHSGYFSDLDGHLWEVAWNPYWELQSDGTIRLP